MMLFLFPYVSFRLTAVFSFPFSSLPFPDFSFEMETPTPKQDIFSYMGYRERGEQKFFHLVKFLTKYV